MAKVLYEKDGRIGRITLNRPEVMNAIDDDLPRELAAAVAQADADRGVHVMVLSGAGKGLLRRLRPGPLRVRRRPQSGGAGHALGPDAGFPVHVGQHPGLHVAVPGNETSDLQGAWARRRGRFGTSRSVPISRSWGTPRESATCPPASGAVRPRRCGCTGWGRRRPSA